jgi:hypothetical protein
VWANLATTGGLAIGRGGRLRRRLPALGPRGPRRRLPGPGCRRRKPRAIRIRPAPSRGPQSIVVGAVLRRLVSAGYDSSMKPACRSVALDAIITEHLGDAVYESNARDECGYNETRQREQSTKLRWFAMPSVQNTNGLSLCMHRCLQTTSLGSVHRAQPIPCLKQQRIRGVNPSSRAVRAKRDCYRLSRRLRKKRGL